MDDHGDARDPRFFLRSTGFPFRFLDGPETQRPTQKNTPIINSSQASQLRSGNDHYDGQVSHPQLTSRPSLRNAPSHPPIHHFILHSTPTIASPNNDNNGTQDKASQGQAALQARAVLTELIEAAASNDTAKLDALLQQEKARHPDLGDDPAVFLRQYKDANGRTALHFACHAGQVEMVRHILDMAPEGISWTDEKGDTPLILAAAGGGGGGVAGSRGALIELLLAKGANPNQGPEKKEGQQQGARALHHSAAHNDVKAIQALLKAGADVNAPTETGTALHWASGEGAREAVHALINDGADVNAVNEQGLASIILAAAHGCGGCVAALAKAGADVGFVLSGGGLTALHMIAEYGSLEGVKAILDMGAQGLKCAVHESENGKPVHLAAWGGHQEVVEALLPHSDVKESVSELMEWGKAKAAAYEEEQKLKTEHDHHLLAQGQDSHPILDLPPAAASPVDEQEAQKFKEVANRHFVGGEFETALGFYDQAIALNGREAAFWSNRAGCLMKLERFEEALRDAELARALKPEWAKACFRMAEARLALGRWEDAALAAYEGVQMDAGNQALHKLLRTAIERRRYAC